MLEIQRYVSHELTHFVGRGKTEEDQYDLLVNKIIKTGWLMHPPYDIKQKAGWEVRFDALISKDVVNGVRSCNPTIKGETLQIIVMQDLTPFLVHLPLSKGVSLKEMMNSGNEGIAKVQGQGL